MNRFLSFLGLCKKAGKSICGFEPVKEAVRQDKAELIMLASDLSKKTEKEIRFVLGLSTVKVHKINVCMNDLGKILGKRPGVVAITDKEFSKKLSLLICQEELNI